MSISLVLIILALVLAVLSIVPVAARFPLLNVSVILICIVWILGTGIVHFGSVH
jgi:hypothetical protein